MKKIIIVCLLVLCEQVFPQDTVNVQYTIQFGTFPNKESGAQSAIGISSLLFDQLNLSIKKIKNKPLNTATRVVNFGLIQFWFGSQLYATLPHELFGHNSTAATFGIKATSSSSFPGLGGTTVFYANQGTPAYDRQMIMAAGPEVTATIAYKATQELYSQEYAPSYIGNYIFPLKFVDEYDYWLSSVKPFMQNPNQYYKDNASFIKKNPVPNDPISYILALTESYGYYPFMNKNTTWLQQFPDMTVYTNNAFIKDESNRMKRAYLLTTLDPTNLYFIYGNALYLAKGQTFFKPFMFKIGNVSFMPSVRANMGDLGVENYYDMYFKIKNVPVFNIYYRNGGNMFDQLNGFGTDMRNIKLNKRINLSAQADYWNNQRNRTNNFNVTSILQVSDKKHLFSVLGTTGYKTQGDLMGKPLNQGFYFYIGIGLNLNYIRG